MLPDKCKPVLIINCIKYGHLHVKVSHGCLAATQLWKLDYLYVLYSGVPRQQGVRLIRAFFRYRCVVLDCIDF